MARDKHPAVGVVLVGVREAERQSNSEADKGKDQGREAHGERGRAAHTTSSMSSTSSAIPGSQSGGDDILEAAVRGGYVPCAIFTARILLLLLLWHSLGPSSSVRHRHIRRRHFAPIYHASTTLTLTATAI